MSATAPEWPCVHGCGPVKGAGMMVSLNCDTHRHWLNESRPEPEKLELWEVLKSNTGYQLHILEETWQSLAKASIEWFKERLPGRTIVGVNYNEGWNACLDEIHRILEEEMKP